MKKIIVPTDFSQSALNALKIAADIALKQSKSEIHIVHVYERPISGMTLQFEIDNKKLRELKKNIMEKMEELCNKDFLKDIIIDKHLIVDKNVWEFIYEPKLRNADLIVMGTHGLKGKPGPFIGSNTQKVAQLTDIPLLIIKDNVKQFELKNLVFASSFGKETDNTFSKIKEIATLFDSTIHLLRVNTRSDFETTTSTYSAMEFFAKKFKLKKFTMNVYNDKTVEDGIIHFNGKVKPDLIAMETHERSRLQSFLNPGITRRVTNYTWKPVLSVKIKEDQVYEDYDSDLKNGYKGRKTTVESNPVFV